MAAWVSAPWLMSSTAPATSWAEAVISSEVADNPWADSATLVEEVRM